jgi:sulfur carrier protein
MTVTVNGQRRTLGSETSVADVVVELGHPIDRPGAAVAVNDEIVPRGQWRERVLRDGDRVEVVNAIQGG